MSSSLIIHIWGYSLIGRVFALQANGYRFKSGYLHSIYFSVLLNAIKDVSLILAQGERLQYT